MRVGAGPVVGSCGFGGPGAIGTTVLLGATGGCDWVAGVLAVVEEPATDLGDSASWAFLGVVAGV